MERVRGNHRALIQPLTRSGMKSSPLIDHIQISASARAGQNSPRCQSHAAATLPSTTTTGKGPLATVSPAEALNKYEDEDEGHGWDEHELARQQVDQESQVTLEWPAICRQVCGERRFHLWKKTSTMYHTQNVSSLSNLFFVQPRT